MRGLAGVPDSLSSTLLARGSPKCGARLGAGFSVHRDWVVASQIASGVGNKAATMRPCYIVTYRG